MNTLLIILALLGVGVVLIGLAQLAFHPEDAVTPPPSDGNEGEDPCCGGDLGPCTCGRSEAPDDETPPTAG